ncbi:hypothetical protein CGCF415_v012369 [Colletotrichum fructicola]|uniref:Uncharacterized protein n=1 Tax=Colletotrichum fructicola (strain Nara gc5) TaxID=1213859 RepID=L2FZ19_COLFN|nr:hypothetical protein CGCFRS4_v010848 [Colletotrichum fructicola]KAF4894101.1 hypothetical protein CGCF415_v012369 [Colletotrichum fructicola]KAF4929042.1 hypothetical protein CGCF245_v012325 [Colletotrichum fructicola]
MPQRGTSLRGGRGGKAAGGAAKRKRDASDAGNMDGIQKRRTDSDSKEEGREWTKQYYQGKSVLDEDMKGMGCGWCRLITPEVPFQSPFACAGNIEVSSGTEGPGGGSIRLCGPKNYFGFNKDGIFDAIFLIPFRHIAYPYHYRQISFGIMAARGSLSDCRTPEEKAVARRKLERMMDPADAGNLNGIQKRRTTSAESREAGCAWEQQYYQGVRSSKFPGLGCGLYAFGSPRVPFQAPFTCDGRFEVMSGLGGPRSGSIRFCGPKDYWGVTKPLFPRLDAIFILPFKHVEQVIVIPNLSISVTKR